MNSSILMSSSLVHLVVAPVGEVLRPYEFARAPLLARAPPTYEYCLFILSMRSFFSFA